MVGEGTGDYASLRVVPWVTLFVRMDTEAVVSVRNETTENHAIPTLVAAAPAAMASVAAETAATAVTAVAAGAEVTFPGQRTT